MYAPQRRFLAAMAVFAALCCLPAALLGDPSFVLYPTPLLLILGLLLCGRYVGEERIHDLRRAALAAPRRRAPRQLPRPASERPLASLLDRCTRPERGPPLAVALTA
jgi:hypothetical protein